MGVTIERRMEFHAPGGKCLMMHRFNEFLMITLTQSSSYNCYSDFNPPLKLIIAHLYMCSSWLMQIQSNHHEPVVHRLVPFQRQFLFSAPEPAIATPIGPHSLGSASVESLARAHETCFFVYLPCLGHIAGSNATFYFTLYIYIYILYTIIYILLYNMHVQHLCI